ncbi:type IV pilus secretin family protein [Desulfomonile tiedjei]|uniref:Type II secretory pathway, component HofQ n=1 Tax=Desulfomonile tiedjei (strain ATCC 49306 / DSM 6799 / DCB-1) TaxID=706587 RepID=I4C2L6_DESTA|nr:AMIN domain-containing protein [Desulfomonile tiedjei]AFM23807.1 type II secretory pathway, component HofQ [Desulfomonile tiedjei DSM 6799]
MRSPEKRYKSLWLSCLLIAMVCSYAGADPGELTGIDVNEEGKTLVIATKGTAGKHLARVIGNPNRLVLDFEGTSLGKVQRKVSVNKRDIHEIRIGTHKSNARIVVDFQDRPVPPFTVRREQEKVLVAFGTSISAELGEANPAHEDKEQSARGKAPLDPKLVPAAAKPIEEAPAPQEKSIRVAVKPDNSSERGSKFGELRQAAASNIRPPEVNGIGKLSQNMERHIAPPPMLKESDVQTDAPAQAGGASRRGGGPQMVKEVRPPVTPPTPDPRLLVQEITELKFIQVGHNARLMVMGGDHLDYRVNKISPTKVRLDLINAEIPKIHQKPLRTDLFSTSVEMIIPGTQNIFIQLKDAVPYQVEKKKGVLMVDFPPPRFVMTPDQKGQKGPDVAKQQAVSQARESRREAMRIIREEQILKDNEARRRTLDSLQKQIDELQKQRTEILKKQQVTPDPEIFNKPITMDFQGISLKNAFRLLAEQAGINIIVGDEVTGTTTLRLFQVPLGQVIDTILNTHKLDREMVGNVMRVGKREEMSKLKTEKAAQASKDLADLDNRIAAIRQDIQKRREEMNKALADLEQKDAGEIPVEEVNTEEFGEAGCVDIEGETVCFYYALTKLVYQKPSDIIRTLNCVFNLKCGDAGPRPGTVAALETDRAEKMKPFLKQIEDQGRSLYGREGRELMERASRMISEQQTAEAQARTAEAIQRGPRVGVAAPGAAPMDPRLAQIIVNSMMWADDTNRTIFIKDTAERLAQIKKMIYSMDKPLPQVLIESRVVVASKGWTRGVGITWGGRNAQSGPLTNNRKSFWGIAGGGATAASPTTGVTSPAQPEGTPATSAFAVNLPVSAGQGALDLQFGFLSGNYATDLNSIINIGELNRQAKTISRPKVQVLDGKEAKITIGSNIAYPGLFEVTWVKAALELTVKPLIYADGRVQMDIKITDDAPGAVLNGFTSIDTRAANTVMIVKDGDTAVIGGINRTISSSTREGWPGLMNVPVINYLFSNRNKDKSGDDLLVFITPTIVKRPPLAS